MGNFYSQVMKCMWQVNTFKVHLQAMQEIIYLSAINTIESMEPHLFIFTYLLLLLYLTLHIVFEAMPPVDKILCMCNSSCIGLK